MSKCLATDLTDLVIVSNSPGELAVLVKPLVKKFKENAPELSITLVLTPCQYQSGREKEFSTSLQVDQIIAPEEYKRFALFGKLPPRIHLGERGKVLFTGGDLLHAVIIAKRLKYRAYAYLGEHLGWVNQYEKFFVADEKSFQRFSRVKAVGNKLILSGNLMADSITPKDALNTLPLNPHQPVLAFLPGSRPFQLHYLIPYYLKIFDRLFQKAPAAQLILSLSPFTTYRQIEKASRGKINIIASAEPALFEYRDRTILVVNRPYLGTTLAVTIPGSNTAQLAVLGIPMLVIFPLDKPEAIPLEGLPSLVDKIPLVRTGFKKSHASLAQRKKKFWSLPNLKSNQQIVPEMVGKISPEEVAERIVLLLANQELLARMRSLLPTSLGPAGAAEKIAASLLHKA